MHSINFSIVKTVNILGLAPVISAQRQKQQQNNPKTTTKITFIAEIK